MGFLPLKLRYSFLLLLLPSVLLFPAFTVLTSAKFCNTCPPPVIPLVQKTWGGNAIDSAQSVAVDTFGDIYITGNTNSFGVSPGFDHPDDVFLLKYSSSGNLTWQRTWGGSQTDEASGVAVDALGDAYVTGYTFSFGSYPNARSLFLLKFLPTGDIDWQHTWGGDNADSGSSVAVDGGWIYVTGNTGSSGNGGILLLKFDSLGTLKFQENWGAGGGDEGASVAVDSSSNVYVAGALAYFGGGGYDAYISKLTATSNMVWQRSWGGPDTEAAYGVAVDSSDGSVYVTGSTSSFGAGSEDVIVLKFDSAGNLKWQVTWGGASTDIGEGIAVDPQGNIFLTGETYSFGKGSEQVFLLKIDPSGGSIWQRLWSGSKGDAGLGLALDSQGNPVVVGSVGEAAPYAFQTIDAPLGNPNVNPMTPVYKPGASQFVSLLSPSGTMTKPTGSETYSGGGDAFFTKFGAPPSAPSFTISIVLLPLVVALAALPLVVRRIRILKRRGSY